jgi:hypothetical protein
LDLWWIYLWREEMGLDGGAGSCQEGRRDADGMLVFVG